MDDGPAWATPKPTGQEALFLTHLVRHHGQATLTPPPNFGRRRQPDEPTASTSDAPRAKAKKKKKKKKVQAGTEILEAVLNAGRTTPTPPSNGEGAEEGRPPMERSGSSGLRVESAEMRGRSSEGSRASVSLPLAVVEEVAASSRSYNRGSIFENLDELGEALPAFATQQLHSSSSATYAELITEALPSSPPPAYPARSRSTSPISPLDQTFATPPESSTPTESPILPPTDALELDDPFVLAWEADRAAGLTLDERIERDLARRLRSAATPSPSQPLPLPPPLPRTASPPPPPIIQSNPALSHSSSIVDVDQAERQEIAEAEADQDAPRVARALSVRAGRRFAEAAEKRRERERRNRLLEVVDEDEAVDASTAPIPVLATAAPPRADLSASRIESPTPFTTERRAREVEEVEEESESDEEESGPARLARAVSVNASRHFAEAAERRMALERAQRLGSIAESPRPPSPPSTSPPPPTRVDLPTPSPFHPRPFGLTSSPRHFGLVEASRPSPAPPRQPAHPPLPQVVSNLPPLAPRPSASSRLASASTSGLPRRPRTPPIPSQPTFPEDTASKGKARATDDGESTELPPRRAGPPPPPSRLSSAVSGRYPPPEGPPPPVARPQGVSRTPSLPPEPNPSILSYLSQHDRDGLADPLEPYRSPTTPTARIPGRFPSLRRPAPPPPPSRPPPPRPPPPPPPLATIPLEPTPSRRERRPLPIPPGPSDRVDAYTVLRERAAAQPAMPPATSHSDHLVVDAEIGAGLPPRPPSATSSFEVPLPSELEEGGEPSQAAVAPSAGDDFVYTDLDLLLARLEDNNLSNYDELLLVGEVLGPAQAVASSLAEIESLDVARVELVRRRVDKQGRVKQKLSVVGVRCVDCMVCLARFRVDEFAVVLPRCLHVFHAECLTKWLLRSQQCPVCRTDAFEPRIVDI